MSCSKVCSQQPAQNNVKPLLSKRLHLFKAVTAAAVALQADITYFCRY